MFKEKVLPIGVAREVVQRFLCHRLVPAHERIEGIAEMRWNDSLGQTTQGIHRIGNNFGHVSRREIRMNKNHGEREPYLARGASIPRSRKKKRV